MIPEVQEQCVVSCRVVSCRVVSCRLVLCCVVSYQQPAADLSSRLCRSGLLFNVRCSSLCTCKHTLMCKVCGVKSQQTVLLLEHNRKASATTSESAEDVLYHENMTAGSSGHEA